MKHFSFNDACSIYRLLHFAWWVLPGSKFYSLWVFCISVCWWFSTGAWVTASLLLWIFPTSVSWWSFTWVWVRASLLRFPGLFSVFWPILVMQSFGWSRFVFQFSTLTVSFPNLCGPFHAHQLQLVSSLFSCSTAFLVLWQDLSTSLCFRFLWSSLCGPLRWHSLLYDKLSFLFF